MVNTYIKEDWAIDAKKALNFFVSRMGDDRWSKRREKVVSYFRDLEAIQFGFKKPESKEKVVMPIAIYDDWIAWYMYLVESIFERPLSGDALQSARIFPFFSMIGKNLSLLLEIDGIEKKIEELLNEKKNQPDAIFFELAVANLYNRNGWKVCFIPESIFYKTPDLQIRKDGQQYWVECKRMQKVPEYSESERSEWQNRSLRLTTILQEYKLSYSIDIIFKVPVSETGDNILVDCFNEYLKIHRGDKQAEIKTPEVEITFRPLDVVSINKDLKEKDIRNNSPELIEVCVGKYESGGNYVSSFNHDEFYKLGLDKNFDVLNVYIDKVKSISILKWTSVSEHSINMKAKDVKRLLVKAVDQIPFEGSGIIHIGYENLDGPYVERKRFLKSQDTIQGFDYKEKNIRAIHCNSLQLLASSNSFDWAETTCFYKQIHHPVLEHDLLLADSVSGFNRPHWEDDIENLERSN